MRLLVSGATTTLEAYRGSPFLGILAVPGAHNRLDQFPEWPLAADNGAFSAFDPKAYRAMLDRLTAYSPLWVTVPDRVGDARTTRSRFDGWIGELTQRNLPAAYVLQDGETVGQIPWAAIAAVFIGGTTAWKLGVNAAHLVSVAKAHGKWVHMGRVNTRQRIRYAQAIGCDSIDGTGFSRFPATHLPWATAYLATEQQTWNEVWT